MPDHRWLYIFVSAIVGIGCAIIIAYFKEKNNPPAHTNTSGFEFNADKWDYVKATFASFDTKFNSIETLMRTLTQDFSLIVDRRYRNIPVDEDRRN